MPATIANRVAARPVTVSAAIVGVPLSLSTAEMFARNIPSRATPRVTSTPTSRVFAGALAGAATAWPTVFVTASAITITRQSR